MKPLISSKQVSFAIAMIATGILLAFLLSFSETGVPTRFGKQPESSNSPDFYILDTETHQFSKEGLLISQFDSEKVQHIPNTDTASMLFPRHISLKNDHSRWVTTANKGLLYLKGDQLDLMQQVLIVNEQEGTRIQTAAMTIFPNEKIAKSKKIVTITHKQGFTRAKGMHANLASEKITLLSQVRGQYHATPQ